MLSQSLSLRIGPVVGFTPISLIDSFSQLLQKAAEYALRYFGLLQACGMSCFGIIEIAAGCSSRKLNCRALKESMSAGLMKGAIKIQKILSDLSLMHGLFYFASGALCAVGELELNQWINIGGMGARCIQFGWTFFLFANLFALEQNLKLYHSASQLKQPINSRLQLSAALGIMNNLGYVCSTVFSIFNGTLALAIVLGALVIVSGTIKFFVDFFYVDWEKLQVKSEI